MSSENHEPVTRRPADELIRDKRCLQAARDFVRIGKYHLYTLAQPFNEMATFAPVLAFRQASQAYSLRAQRFFVASSAVVLLAGADVVINGQENSAERNMGSMSAMALGLRTALRSRRKQYINENLVDWAHERAGPSGFPALVERVQQEINRQSPGLRQRP